MSGGFAYVANGPPPAAPGPRGPPRVAPMPPPPPFAPSALPDPLQPSVPNPFGGDRGGLAPPVMPARPPRQGPKLEYPRLTYASVVVEMGVVRARARAPRGRARAGTCIATRGGAICVCVARG
jgi:hypothetical protein